MLPAICLWCKYYEGRKSLKDNPSCSAFPNSIPKEIWNKEIFHENPYDGDNGIQFVKQDKHEELPKDLKIILERSKLNSDELLDWVKKMVKSENNNEEKEE